MLDYVVNNSLKISNLNDVKYSTIQVGSGMIVYKVNTNFEM